MIEEFATDDGDRSDRKYRLVIRCTGLNVNAKSLTQTNGLFTNIMNMSTGNNSLKNEKRYVRLFQSRNDQQGYEQFYQSEVIEDIPVVCPSLIAEINCALDRNIIIKVHVMYTSNLASKEIVLAHATFSFDELQRQPNGILEFSLTSDHAPGAKAAVELLLPLRPVLQDPHMLLCAPINTSPDAPNPLNQNYVFYAEDDMSSPLVHVEEYTWEPRLAMKLSLLFLDNIRIKAFQSYQAWTERLLLEEMRQGHFGSATRAVACGWHQLSVGIRGARINCIDFASSRRTSKAASSESLSSGMLSKERMQPPPMGAQTPQQNTVAYYSHYPIYFNDIPSVEPSIANDAATLSNRRMPSSDGRASSRSLSTSSQMRSSSSSGKSSASMMDQLRATKKKVRIDETLPSTFVEIYYEDSNQLFAYYLGRSNTEYHTFHPAYGSNTNAEWARKANTEPVAGTAATIEKSSRLFHMLTLESLNKFSNPRVYHPRQLADLDEFDLEAKAAALIDQKSISSTDTILATSLLGAEYQFVRFVPNANAAVRFDMYLEDAAGSRSPLLIGSGSLSISDISCFTSEWIKLTPVTSASFLAFDSIELLVTLDLLRSTVQAITEKVVVSKSEGLATTVSVEQSESASNNSTINNNRSSNSNSSSISDNDNNTNNNANNNISSSSNSLNNHENSNDNSNNNNNNNQATNNSGNNVTAIIEFTNIAPCKMPEVVKTIRKQDGTILSYNPSLNSADSVETSYESTLHTGNKSHSHSSNTAINELEHPSLPDYRSSISRSYDWLWHVGFNGLDPLVDEYSQSRNNNTNKQSQSSLSCAEAQSSTTSASVSASAAVTSSTNSNSRRTSKDNNYPTAPDFQSESAKMPTSSILKSIPVSASASVSTTSVSISIIENPAIESTTPLYSEENLLSFTDNMQSNDNLSDVIAIDGEEGEGIEVEIDISDGNNDANAVSEQLSSVSLSATTTATATASTQSNASSKPIQQTASKAIADVTNLSKYIVIPRVDVPYSIAFLKQHIESMQLFFAEIGTLRAEGEAWLRQGHQFRPSTMKKEMKVQFFPTNLHIQLMCIRPHQHSDRNVIDCVDSITSGCMSPHGLGHKKGGLTVLEDELLKQKVKIDTLKARFTAMISAKRATSNGCLSPNGPEAELLEEIGKQIIAYEGGCMNIGKRRVFVLSQAVSTAATAFMLKLCLVLEGHIDASVAEKWLSIGFLIVFEGLLSVSGKEKSMLEDTQSAVESIKLFQIRLLPSPSITRSNASSGYTSTPLGSQSILSDMLDVGFSGREIRIYLPPPLITKLPASYKQKLDKGVVISLVPVLFTQGIDMNQTLAAQFSLDSTSTTQIQLQINLRSFRHLNNYCQKMFAVSKSDGSSIESGKLDRTASSSIGTASSLPSSPTKDAASATMLSTRRQSISSSDIHPLLRTLSECIQRADASAKNVDMLLEVERACFLLNGCRVTFCKSGKDRTGMAVTLEQARQLGDRYRLGEGTARLLRDANLFRLYGTRVAVAAKNIGKRVFSFNRLQVQFLPLLYRPPPQVCELMMKKDNS